MRQFSSVGKFIFYFNPIARCQPQYTTYVQATTSFQDYNVIVYLHNSILITFLQELLYLTSWDAYIIITSFRYYIHNSILITFLQELLYLTSWDAYIIITSFRYYINYHLFTRIHHNHQVNMKALSFSLSSSPFCVFPLLEIMICFFLCEYGTKQWRTVHYTPQMLKDAGGSMHTVLKGRMQNPLSWG